LGSPAATEVIKRELAAGIRPNEVFVPRYAPGRERRNLARIANLVWPGSGNFVSGDWDHITENDFLDLGLSGVRNLLFSALGPEALGSRAALGEAAELPGVAAGAQAARAAISGGGPARANGPLVGKINPPPMPRVFPIEPPGGISRPATPTVESSLQDEGPRYIDPATVPLVPYDAESALAAARTRGINLDELSARANQIHSALDPRAQRHRTTAVLLTDGPTIIGGGGEDLEDFQRAMLRDGEISAELPGVHAEKTVLTKAMANFHRPRALATSRPFCPKECPDFIRSLGGILTSDRTAVFPPF
jgi:hypothetical protein